MSTCLIIKLTCVFNKTVVQFGSESQRMNFYLDVKSWEGVLWSED